MREIKIKKSLLTGAIALSSVAILVPTLLTSCSNKPKYTISWSTQIFDSITPYVPTDNKEYYMMDQSTALNLWMDNLSDKEKTLDMFSLPLALMETYLEPFYDPSGQQSPVSIEVYKSAFQWSKNTEIYNYATGNFNKNDIILWSFSLKIKVFPSIPLDALSTLLNALKIMPTPITLPDWNIDSVSLSVNNFPIAISCLNLMDGIFGPSDRRNGDDEGSRAAMSSSPTASFNHMNAFYSFDWSWDDPLAFIGPMYQTSITDAVDTSGANVKIHVVAPFDKTISYDFPGGYLYSGLMMGQWMMSIGPVSYYLSNLSLNPPQQTK